MSKGKLKFFFAVFALLLTGCVKDDPGDDFLKLFAEGYNPDSSAKAAVMDDKTFWVDGENVWVNGGSYRVHVNGSNEAIIRGVASNDAHTYRAVYPSSAFVNASVNNFTVTIPRVHQYKESGGKQVIDQLPMVSFYSDDKDPESMQFKHLTAAITVQVRNTRTANRDTLELDRIDLINTHYALSGDVVVDIRQASLDGNLTVSDRFLDRRDSVSMIFYHDENMKKVAPGKSADIQIPILPVGENKSSFMIRVVGHIKGAKFVFEKSTPARDNTIIRACLGYATTKFEDESKGSDLFDVKTEQTINDNGEVVTRNFYEISSADELLALAQAMDSGWSNTAPKPTSYRMGNYILVNDIDMHGASIVPIHYYNKGGGERVYFYGNNKTIRNFVASSVDELEANCCGLFSRTAGDSITIMDLWIEDAVYEYSHTAQKIMDYDDNPCSAVGGIFACVDHAGIVIENCHVNNVKMGSISNTQSGEKQTDFYAGGIVGVVFTSCTIRNCSVGTVEVDNTYDASSGALVDQFGAAVARIDVGDKEGSNTYGKMIRNGCSPEEVPAVVIEKFTYDQGSTPLVFSSGLKNIRCGGIVGNITRGGRLIMKGCRATLNVRIDAIPSSEMYVSGMLGCLKITDLMGVYVSANCEIHGTIVNNAISSYKDTYCINKYFSGPGIKNIVALAGSSQKCVNDLTVSGMTSAVKNVNQVFPTPKS